jgi:GH15 family glucan-1,4-alpha-glucosidase
LSRGRFYGKSIPHLNDRKNLGVQFVWKENIYTLLSTLEPEQLIISKDKDKAIAEFKLRQGEQVIFSLSYSSQSPAIIPELKTTGKNRIRDTMSYWKKWISNCRYSGLFEDQVRRSALILKLLTHAPSGAIIAAPTTSLPEKAGGVRNWTTVIAG